MFDTTQRTAVYACMACYVLFIVLIATPDRHVKRAARWVATSVRQLWAPNDDANESGHHHRRPTDRPTD